MSHLVETSENLVVEHFLCKVNAGSITKLDHAVVKIGQAQFPCLRAVNSAGLRVT